MNAALALGAFPSNGEATTRNVHVAESYRTSTSIQELIGRGTSAYIVLANQQDACTDFHSAHTRMLFNALTQQWRDATQYLSSVHAIVLHPAYQKIIGMGERAIPYILKELDTDQGLWAWALNSISGENPVPPEDAGNMARMADAWRAWGSRRGRGRN